MEPEQKKLVFNAPPQPTITQSMEQGATEAQTHIANKTPSVRSFAYDIKSSVNSEGISLAKVVMAESRRREDTNMTLEDISKKDQDSSILKFILISIGVVALLGGVGIFLFTLYTSTPVDPIVVETARPQIIRTEKTISLNLRDGYRSTLVQAIEKTRASNVAVGTLEDIQIIESIADNESHIDSNRFLSIMESTVPETLSRSLLPQFAFGIYSWRQNAPYIILKSSSYDNAYVGMLEWEKSMVNDIGPLLFDKEGLEIGVFKDMTFKNKDTRVILNPDGEAIMLWSIINKNYIIIATNGEALEEIVQRITTSNIVR